MNKNLVILFVIGLMIIPLASAYSPSEFINDLKTILSDFSITGFVILEVAEETKEVVMPKKEPLSPPEPKKIEVKEDSKNKEIQNKEGIETNIAEKTEETTEEEGQGPIASGELETTIEKPKTSTSSSSSTSKKSETRLPSCSDFEDNNINYFKKGTCKDKRGRISSNEYLSDYCSTDGNMVMEYSCGKEDLCEGNWYVCESGCEEGKCISISDTTTTKELEPDFKIISTETKECKLKSNIKNVGTKASDFEVKFTTNENKVNSKIDYTVEPGEIIEFELDIPCFTTEKEYSLEIISEEDSNKENNIKEDKIIVEKKPIKTEITGNVVIEENINKENKTFVEKIKDLLKRLFDI